MSDSKQVLPFQKQMQLVHKAKLCKGPLDHIQGDPRLCTKLAQRNAILSRIGDGKSLFSGSCTTKLESPGLRNIKPMPVLSYPDPTASSFGPILLV